MKFIPSRFEGRSAGRRAPVRQRRDAARAFVLRPLVAALLGLVGGVGGVWAQTLPAGMTVVQGQATVTTQGRQMTVTNSGNAALNWQSFSIGSGAGVRFEQPSASSQVLNRVTGSDPSSILGQMSSNGRVWLLNPNGILFGRDARVDVAGLVASTLHISDADWQVQRFSLGDSSANRAGLAAAVVNQGELRTTTGGRIFLLGGVGGVRNEGLIDTRGGQVALAAGRSIDLVDEGLPNLTVRVQAPQGEALNLGTLSAEGGRIDLSAAIVNQQGLVRADALEGGRGGEIVLKAVDTLETGASSRTSARGTDGGRITLDSGSTGRTQVSGVLDTTGTRGQGGGIRLLGRQIGLLGNAMVDVSGEAGGGEALVGGGLQGRDPSVPHAEAVYVGPEAQLRADALGRGQGGRLIVWSDKATRVYGSLSARGGRLGGDGGLVETSGKWLDARPKSVRADAPSGKAGVWLLDPYDLTISDQVEDSFQSSPDGDYYFVGSSDGPSTLSSRTVKEALESFGGTSVNIYTSSAGPADGGDIFVKSANISIAPTNPVGLQLYAARNIVFDSSSISSTGAPLNVSLNPGGSTQTAGSISFRLSTISTAGAVQGGVQLGNILLGNGELSAVNQGGGNGSGVYLDNSTLNAGAGRIAAQGISYANDVDAYGVRIGAGSVLSAADVSVQGTVVSSGSTATVFPPHERKGVAVEGRIDATHSMVLTGNVRGGVNLVVGAGATSNPTGTGVDITGELSLHPVGTDATSSLSVSGAVSIVPTNAIPGDQRYSAPLGVGFRAGTSSLSVGGGATVTITGSATGLIGSDIAAPTGTMDLSSAGLVTLTGNRFISLGSTVVAPTNATLSISASGDGGQVDLQPANLSGSPALLSVSAPTVSLGGRFALDGSGTTQIRAELLTTSSNVPNGGAALDFSSGGPVALEANQIQFGAGTVIRSSASGDAIRLSGSGTNLSRFGNGAGAPALSTPNGRWLVYAADPAGTTNTTSFSVGGLDYAAVVYNRTYAGQTTQTVTTALSAATLDAPLPAGNLLLFSVAPVLSRLDSSVQLGRTYNGTTTMPLTGTGIISGEINGDRISGTFSDRNVGTGKAIALVTAIDGSVQGVDVNGKPVLGYLLATPFTLSGDIRPATLTYIATPTTRVEGDALSGFTGTVQGFVTGETLQNATSGTLLFRTAATLDSAPGTYAINGAGLSATNYTFTQAGPNATALSLAARPIPDVRPLPVSTDLIRPVDIGLEEDLKLQRARVLPLMETSTATQGRVADALWNLNEVWSLGRAFGRVDVGSMSQAELAALLEARDRYKQSIFAAALRQLEENPTRADAPPCESIEQARAGTCLMTESLKAAYVATVQQGAAETPPVSVPSSPADSKPARPAVPVPEIARPVTVPTGAVPALPEVLSTRRPALAGVATLPQIQRKLALVIGIDNHADRRVPGLDNARADASAVADVLTRRLGYETTLLTDGTRATILGQLNRMALEARAADSVVIYYAGHGSVVEKTGLGYWQPADADAERSETWVSNADIGRIIGQITSNQVALISDSCYSGRLVAGERIRPADHSVSAATLLNRKAAVVMSSGGNEPVADSGKNGHSAFAWNLMRAIEKVGPWRPGANVFEQVRFAVARELPQRPQYGAALAGGHQAGADYVFESR